MNMVNDTARLSNDLLVTVSTLAPDIETNKVEVWLEEVLSNYEIHRRTQTEIENDLIDKIDIYVSARKVEGYSKKTLKGHRIELNMFARFVNKAVVQVTTSDIRKYLASNSKWMMSTVDNKLSKIKTFFSWLVDEEMLLRNPASKIKPPKKPKRLPKAITVEELELVRESCKTLRERALMEVLYSTGCRLSETKNMKISDVVASRGKAKVIGKGDKERSVHLSPKALYHLRKYLASRNDDCEYLFCTVRKPYRQLNRATVGQIIDKIEKRANISKKLTPHVFRHTKANLMIENGADLADVQAVLGHANPGTTMLYFIVSEERKELANKRHHVQ